MFENVLHYTTKVQLPLRHQANLVKGLDLYWCHQFTVMIKVHIYWVAVTQHLFLHIVHMLMMLVSDVKVCGFNGIWTTFFSYFKHYVKMAKFVYTVTQIVTSGGLVEFKCAWITFGEQFVMVTGMIKMLW